MANGYDGVKISPYLSVIPLICALALILVGLFSTYGWLYTIMYWPVAIIGIIALVIAIRKNSDWWLLITLPVFLYPLIMGALVLYSCSQGNCL